MLALGIETSCDETSLAVLDDSLILASETFSQADIHAVFGGVVPEIASRNHMAKIGRLFDKVLSAANITPQALDLIAVTNAPGLIGALFVGVSFAKGLAFALKKPIVPVHHLAGHILSAELSNPGLTPPYAALVASGGHTHIYDVYCGSNSEKDNGQTQFTPISFTLWGRAIDDAAGEAFDKVAKMLGGTYPGGPFVEKLAAEGNPHAIVFPSALKDKNDFSFSGLKTAVLNKVAEGKYSAFDIAASFQYAVAHTLAEKAVRAATILNRKNISVSGGVVCNKSVRTIFKEAAKKNNLEVFFPAPELSSDNGAMIAYAAIRMIDRNNLDRYKDLTFSAIDTLHEI